MILSKNLYCKKDLFSYPCFFLDLKYRKMKLSKLHNFKILNPK